jgi:hypothetical protein
MNSITDKNNENINSSVQPGVFTTNATVKKQAKNM